MTAFNHPITLNIQVYTNQENGISTVQVQSDGQQSVQEVVTQPTDLEAMRRFYEDSWGLIVLRFTNYKGILFSELPREEASKGIQEIQTSLWNLPVRPNAIVDGDGDFTVAWVVPNDRRFCGFSAEDLNRVNDNVIATIASLGLTTPEYGDIGLVEELFSLPVDQYDEHVEKRAKLEAFDRMAGLQIVVRQTT
ncbi:hypothetical protein EDM59_01820 [Brevibacillus nitrificans]|uniref:Uncharacterized protein n=1 Tax=Brevibacillus nitrificans TaxID=651560 RepID=A0A3M8DT96_9BACL|nr:hypothetical protein [Brevibacillus nitrificans]RNB90207.1 hypothetical protein EDM59_01820 [Brevibacillus nitrificans]